MAPPATTPATGASVPNPPPAPAKPPAPAAASGIVPTVGRTVLYRMPTIHGGVIRPAIVVAVNGTRLNLSVQLDGSNDGVTETTSTRWVPSIEHDQDTKRPGSWHWMAFQQGQSAASSQVTVQIADLSKTIAELKAELAALTAHQQAAVAALTGGDAAPPAGAPPAPEAQPTLKPSDS